MKLHRILSCLLDNSLKYTEEGGIAVDVRPLDQSTWDAPSGAMPLEDGCLLFRIADTGVGIPAERQRHLFQPFAIAEDVLTKKSDGLGLGLSIARMLTEKMGGAIWLESGAGKGTAVYFSLPATGGDAGSIRPGGQ